MKSILFFIISILLIVAYYTNKKYVLCFSNNTNLCEVYPNKFYILWKKEILILSIKEKLISFATPKRFDFWDYHLIARKTKSVVLGDAAKGNSEDSFNFTDQTVIIHRLDDCIIVNLKSKFYDACENYKTNDF